MRSKLSRIILAVTVMLAVGGIGVWSAKADDKKSEEPSAPPTSTSSGVTNNSAPSKPRGDGLKSLEQDLFKPFERIAPQGSLDGAFAPPTPEPRPATPVIQSKRAKELLERQRDWAFETPEEILATPSTDDLLNSRDKQEGIEDKSQLSPVERFYERLYSKDKKDSTYKSTKRDDPFEPRKPGALSDDPTADDDTDLPAGVQEARREMRKLLAPKERKADSSLEPNKSFFSDMFSLNKSKPTREEIETQRERMDRYKELVGLPVTPSLENDPLKPFKDVIGGSPKNGNLLRGMDTLGSLPRQNGFGTPAASGNAVANNPFLPDGAKIYAPPSLAPTLPKMDPPKSLPPPVTFSAPRRAF
jgi:hypothetical protein